ncbi:uncharacterized protein LOC124257255 [Haliotis rubra]|uniref:uncharacterized protein LOC124257255 n=1 Tax=Haliotis rubra TaxID=36100 RepID=UPI001EE4F20A|nr:uncharacterized protein LOC124257255 [Haliotis rubra]
MSDHICVCAVTDQKSVFVCGQVCRITSVFVLSQTKKSVFVCGQVCPDKHLCMDKVLSQTKVLIFVYGLKTKVCLCVWTRDSHQLDFLVAYLSSHLPDDVIISHSEEAGLQCAVKDAVSYLSQEVKTLSICVKTLLGDSSQAVKALMSSSASVAGVTHQDQVTDFQQRFREEQDAVHSCVDTSVTVRDTRVLTDNICRLERLERLTDEHIACMKSVD